MLEPQVIKGTNLPDCWHQTLYRAVEVGRDFKIDRGSNAEQWRKEFDFITIHATCPGVGELLPKLNPALGLDDPCASDYLNKYLPYLMTGEEAENESYTYGQRICKDLLSGTLLRPINIANEKILITDPEIWKDPNIIIMEPSTNGKTNSFYVNQMELMIWTYKNKGYRNNQMIMQVGKPTDMLLQDPPCLRHIDTRIQNNPEKERHNICELFKEAFQVDPMQGATTENLKKDILSVATDIEWAKERIKNCEVIELHFFPYFRSWDLWGGLPANLAAIELMKQYCAEQIGVENGEMIATSKGLHLYNYVWEIAETVRGRTVEEFKLEMGR